MIFLIFFARVPTIYVLDQTCFGSVIRKLVMPLQTPVFLYKSGFKGVCIFTDVFLMTSYFFFCFVRLRESDTKYKNIPLHERKCLHFAKKKLIINQAFLFNNIQLSGMNSVIWKIVEGPEVVNIISKCQRLLSYVSIFFTRFPFGGGVWLFLA